MNSISTTAGSGVSGIEALVAKYGSIGVGWLIGKGEIRQAAQLELSAERTLSDIATGKRPMGDE